MPAKRKPAPMNRKPMKAAARPSSSSFTIGYRSAALHA